MMKADEIRKGDTWIANPGLAYYKGTVEVLRFKDGWVRFELDGHGLEEIREEEFRRYFRRFRNSGTKEVAPW